MNWWQALIFTIGIIGGICGLAWLGERLGK